MNKKINYKYNIIRGITMEILNNLSGCELVSLAAILSVTIAKDLSPDETDTLGNFFSALGSNLSTIAAAQSGEVIT